jgi:hypothetical protein
MMRERPDLAFDWSGALDAAKQGMALFSRSLISSAMQRDPSKTSAPIFAYWRELGRRHASHGPGASAA